jgi:hypothetical protein
MKKLLLTLLSFFSMVTIAQAQCSYTLTLEDSFGDGWQGGTVDVWISGTTTTYGSTFTSGNTETHTINASIGDSVAFIWNGGDFYPSECSFKVEDSGGSLLHQSGNGLAMTVGDVEFGTSCAAAGCDWQLTLLDSFGDGWQGGTVDLYVNGTTTTYGSAFTFGPASVITVPVIDGDSIAVIWNGGDFYPSECSYELSDNNGAVVHTSGDGLSMTVGAVDFGTTATCGTSTGPNPCLVTTFPFTEDFDAWSGTVPTCWAGIKTSTSGGGWTWDANGTGSSGTGPLSANSGSYYVYLEGTGLSTTTTSYIDLPPFDLTSVTNPQLRFYYHMHGSNMGTLSVEVSTDNKMTWNSVYSISGQQQALQNDDYSLDSANLSGYGTSETWIRFVGGGHSGFRTDMAIDDIYVGDGPLCPGSGGVAITNVSGNSATVSWTSSATDHKIEYGLAGFTQGTGSFVSPATSPATLTGLQGSSTYDVYIQDSCSATSVVWVGPYQFTTLQAVMTLPYVEGFESGTGDYLVSGSNSSWEHGAPLGTIIPSAASGSKAWVTNLDGAYNNSENSTLTTPYFDNTTGTFDVVYEFQMALATENNFDETWVEYSFNDTLWTKLLAGDLSENWYNDLGNQWWEGDADPSWKKRLAIIPNSAGETVHIRHQFSSDGSVTREGIGLDDVEAYEIPCDFPVQNLAVSNVTASSFDVHWTSNSTSWEIETGPIGYAQATGVGTITAVTNDTASITINACDSVDLYVRAVCSTNNGPWVGPITVGALCEYDIKMNQLYVDVNTCGDSATSVYAVVENKGMFDATGFPVNTDVTGGLTATLSATYSDTLSVGESDSIMIGTFNSYNGAVGVNIVGYSVLANDQYGTNDSISIMNVGYIGPVPLVAANDTICTTDAFGVLYAEPIAGLRYGWYANPMDTIPAHIGDSLIVNNPGPLTWYLGYEDPLAYTETTFGSNNGGSYGNAFSVLPNTTLSINGFDVNTGAAAGTNVSVYIEYLLDTVTTANNAATAGWIVHDTVIAVAAGNNSPTYVPLSVPLTLPANQVSGLRIGSSSGLRYTNGVFGTSAGDPWITDSKMTIYQGWGLTGSFNPRNWNGRIYYDAGGACSDSMVPVSVEYYSDTAQADFTFTIGADGYTVFFDATNSVGDVFTWDFGDGTTGSGDTITHVFADSVDVYAICLFVNDTVCMTSDLYCDGLVTTIGIEEGVLSQSIDVYPNPSSGNFNVKFTTNVISEYNIEIIDITGRTISTKVGTTNLGENKVLFDTDLSDGVYILRVNVEGDISNSRLVIRS